MEVEDDDLSYLDWIGTYYSTTQVFYSCSSRYRVTLSRFSLCEQAIPAELTRPYSAARPDQTLAHGIRVA